jgi:hypothetical protein
VVPICGTVNRIFTVWKRTNIVDSSNKKYLQRTKVINGHRIPLWDLKDTLIVRSSNNKYLQQTEKYRRLRVFALVCWNHCFMFANITDIRCCRFIDQEIFTTNQKYQCYEISTRVLEPLCYVREHNGYPMLWVHQLRNIYKRH